MIRARRFDVPILLGIGTLVLVAAIILNAIHTGNYTAQITSALDVDNGDTKIDWSHYPLYDVTLTDTLNISKPGTYHLTGSLADGAININAGAEGVVKLILDNVTIINSSGPAINCTAGDDLVIELVGDSTVADGATYSASYDEDVDGAIYSKADLTFQGDGALNLTANYQDGIVSKDDLKFNSGVYHITAADDAVRGKDSVYIVSGDFTINATADGIKSTNETDARKGFVMIKGGNFNIASGDDGIHASHALVIDDSNLAIAKSYEGLEAQIIIINGGNISIKSNDDGINAGSGTDASAANRIGAGAFDADESCIISINGGNLYINASGDGIDSNGWLYFNGGSTIIDGPTNNGNGALDAGMGIVMNGGEVVAIGASGMAESLGLSSTIYNISVYFTSPQAAGTIVEIKNASGDTILMHAAAKTFNHMSAGTKAFNLGETYTIYLNDEKYQDFTISDIVTTVGNSYTNQTSPSRGPRR